MIAQHVILKDCAGPLNVTIQPFIASSPNNP
jgi:hypothetical protein